DTPSSYERVIQTCREIDDEAGAALCIVMCDASKETRAERLRTRERRSSHVTGIDDEAEAVIRERFSKLPKSALRLSTEGPADELVDEVVAYVLAAGNKEDDEDDEAPAK